MSANCRNCGSSDIYQKDVDAKGNYGPDLLPITSKFSFGSPKYRLEVCGACGLVEWFVPEQYLAQMKEVFARVQ